MKSFDNGAHKSQCNHNFYTQTYFYLMLVGDNLYTLFDYFLRKLLAKIVDKSYSK